MSNNVYLHRCWFLLTSFQNFSGQIGFYNGIFLGNMALLIRSYNDISQFLAISRQDLTKISLEGRPGCLLSQYKYCVHLCGVWRDVTSAVSVSFQCRSWWASRACLAQPPTQSTANSSRARRPPLSTSPVSTCSKQILRHFPQALHVFSRRLFP